MAPAILSKVLDDGAQRHEQTPARSAMSIRQSSPVNLRCQGAPQNEVEQWKDF